MMKEHGPRWVRWCCFINLVSVFGLRYWEAFVLCSMVFCAPLMIFFSGAGARVCDG